MGIRTELSQLITQDSTGISFAQFMELALYHPEDGYYAFPRRIGRGGDFFTSVSVGPCFGMLLARQVLEIAEIMGRPAGFTVLEQGAHDGQLARDILTGLPAEWPYQIIEPNPRYRPVQCEITGDRVTHVSTLAEAGPVEGVFLCNELLDAFPVRRFRFEGGQWRESRVVEREGNLVEQGFDWEGDTEDWPEVSEGFCTEQCEGVGPWLDELTATIQRGVVLVIDYGFSEMERFLPERADGTLRGYRDHRRVDALLETPGRMDLTAHVNFSQVAGEARARGWTVVGYADQAQFLTGIGEGWMREIEAGDQAPDPALIRQFQTLTHPGLMGRSFRVLALGKGLASLDLSGFRFGLSL